MTAQPHQRVETIDLCRGGSVVVMVCVHTLWMYGTLETQRDSWLGHALHFLGKGTASFLVAMGFSFMLSRRLTPLASAQRGLSLLAVAYGMNLLKFILPLHLGILPDAFIEAYGWTPPPTLQQQVYLALTGDILQLAGLSLMLMGAIRRWMRGPVRLWLTAAAIAAAPHLVRGVRIGLPNVDPLLDLLWGQNFNVYFPVFPWMAPVVVGMVYGRKFRETGSGPQTFAAMVRPGLALVLLGGGLVLANRQAHLGDFFHLGFGGISYLTGLNLLLLWGVSRLARAIRVPRLRALLVYCSQRVTSLYLVSWVVICWGMGAVGFKTLEPGGILVAIGSTFGLTLAGQRALDTLRARLGRADCPGNHAPTAP